MDQRISLITLGVRDMDRATAFYDAMGWARAPGPDGVIAYDLLGQTLGLFGLDDLAKDIGLPVEELGHGALTLAHNLDSRDAVDAHPCIIELASGPLAEAHEDVEVSGA